MAHVLLVFWCRDKANIENDDDDDDEKKNGALLRPMSGNMHSEITQLI